MRRFSLCPLMIPALALCASTAHAETTGADTDGGGAPSVEIFEPADMAAVGSAPAQLNVEVVASNIEWLFPAVIQLAVDDVVVEQRCTDVSVCLFAIELETEGVHTLQARLSEDVVIQATDEITVVVGPMAEGQTDGPADPTGEAQTSGSTDADTDDGSSGGVADRGKGCSVSTRGPSGLTMAGALLLLAAGAAGRRRRRRA
ncbi:MAG: hypothetical protein AB1Z98_14600 [Nannocystaceae bacterium]